MWCTYSRLQTDACILLCAAEWSPLQFARTQMVRSELAKPRPRAGEADITRQVENSASTLNAGTLTLTTDCAICSGSVCPGQDYSVLGLFTRHWTNKIKKETDHLHIRLCKHLTLCTCLAHRKKAASGFKPIKLLAKSRERVGPWVTAQCWTLLYALGHTRSHKHIFTLCSRLGLESLPRALPSVARSPKQPAASRNVRFKAPAPFATEGC